MSDDEIKELIKQHGFSGEAAENVLRVCREVERTTRDGFFSIIQSANNAARNREVTSRELDGLLWCHDQKKRAE